MSSTKVMILVTPFRPDGSRHGPSEVRSGGEQPEALARLGFAQEGLDSERRAEDPVCLGVLGHLSARARASRVARLRRQTEAQRTKPGKKTRARR